MSFTPISEYETPRGESAAGPLRSGFTPLDADFESPAPAPTSRSRLVPLDELPSRPPALAPVAASVSQNLPAAEPARDAGGLLQAVKDAIFASAPKPLNVVRPDTLMPPAIKDVQQAESFGPEGVLTRLPAALVAGTRSAFADMQRLTHEDERRRRMEQLGYVFPDRDVVFDENTEEAVRIPPVLMKPSGAQPSRMRAEQLAEYEKGVEPARVKAAALEAKAAQAEKDVKLITPPGEMNIPQKIVRKIGRAHV